MATPTKQLRPIGVSVRDAAALSSLCERQIFNLIRRGELQSKQVGKRRIVMYASLLRLLEAK